MLKRSSKHRTSLPNNFGSITEKMKDVEQLDEALARARAIGDKTNHDLYQDSMPVDVHPWLVVGMTQEWDEITSRIKDEFNNYAIIAALLLSMSAPLIVESPFDDNDDTLKISFMYLNVGASMIYISVILYSILILFNINHMGDTEDMCWFVGTYLARTKSRRSYSDSAAGHIGAGIALQVGSWLCVLFEELGTVHAWVLSSMSVGVLLYALAWIRMADNNKKRIVEKDYRDIMRAHISRMTINHAA